MSLIKCEKCGELYSDSYRKCPFCVEDERYYQSNEKRRKHRGGIGQKRSGVWVPLLSIVLVVLLGGGAWYFFGDNIRGFLSGSGRVPVENADTQKEDEQLTAAPVVLEMDKTLRVAPGESKMLSVSGGTSYEWSSSDPTVATVGNDGTVTGIELGTAVITATDSSGQSAVCSVTVTDEADLPDIGGEEDGGDNTSKPVKPADSTPAKVDVSKLQFRIPVYGLSLSPSADGTYDMSIMKSQGETSVEIVVEGTTDTIVWTSANENKVTATGGKTDDGKVSVKFTAVGSGETTVTGKIGEASIEFLVRVK